jgi:hypothetical protein
MFVVSPLFNSDESAYSFPVADSGGGGGRGIPPKKKKKEIHEKE